jgi:hypothetical protein
VHKWLMLPGGETVLPVLWHLLALQVILLRNQIADHNCVAVALYTCVREVEVVPVLI